MWKTCSIVSMTHLKNDYEFLPDAPKGWTRARYNDKLAKIAKVIVATGVKDVPDLVGLCEVENDHLHERPY